MTSYDVIIAGAGHNGLVAANYLAKAGKKVLILEAQEQIGGATQSVKAFEDYEARLSRYSYLIALLPDKIISDLGLSFKNLSRKVSSFTPYQEGGLLISRQWDQQTAESFNKLPGGEKEAKAWQEFYSEIEKFAKRIAPSMLEPLRSSADLNTQIAMPQIWDQLIENPIGHVITEKFKNDLVRGVVLTDALIGTLSSAYGMQANNCFLYHLIGNGSGEWKVPQGGMGAFVAELHRVAISNGVEIECSAKVIDIDADDAGVQVTDINNRKFQAKYFLSNAAPEFVSNKIETRGSLEGSQIKINLLLKRLPQLKSGIDPELAFAGTLHLNESFSELERAYDQALIGNIPDVIPAEMYCHTLTDPTILSPELQAAGFHTLTLFGLHTPATAFEENNKATTKLVAESAIAGLNKYLAEPLEDVLAYSKDGKPCIEAKSPLDLEADLFLPRGNIFHKDLTLPFAESDEEVGKWGVETNLPNVFICGASAKRGGGVSGIPGHNAAMAVLKSK
ncbi:MAG: NAD(P)/FAD-dependent oxidoreductase [Actinobacteria bacterium]|nr:NAD(P)/FAD-dependent oxidoreductase [Actinomycetota bacterium]